MNTNGMPRILIVDDDARIRRALENALSAGGFIPVSAGSAEEGLDRAAAMTFDLVILDLALPGMSGLDMCRQLRQWSDVPILVLSIRERPSDKVAALDLGADDYLTKPFHMEELLARVRAHLRRVGHPSQDAALFSSHGLCLDAARHQVTLNGEELRLTRTEFALLHQLIRNAGRVLTHSYLLGAVWGDIYEPDTPTLRVHMGNLRRKIESDPHRPRFILTEPGVGYRFIDTP